MNEEFVTYQQARLLKECGFDWKCDHYYTNGYVNDDPEDLTRVVKLHIANPYNHNKVIRESECYSAPSQALAQKWMREVYDLHICVDATIGEEEWQFLLRRIHDSIEGSGYGFDSYESALSAGIDAALELIKQK